MRKMPVEPVHVHRQNRAHIYISMFFFLFFGVSKMSSKMMENSLQTTRSLNRKEQKTLYIVHSVYRKVIDINCVLICVLLINKLERVHSYTSLCYMNTKYLQTVIVTFFFFFYFEHFMYTKWKFQWLQQLKWVHGVRFLWFGCEHVS